MLQQKSLVGCREAGGIGFKCHKRFHGLCRKIYLKFPQQFLSSLIKKHLHTTRQQKTVLQFNTNLLSNFGINLLLCLNLLHFGFVIPNLTLKK